MHRLHSAQHFLHSHHAYGSTPHGSGIANLVAHAFVWGLISHVLTAIFRGHSVVGTIAIALVLSLVAFVAFRFLFRRVTL